MLLQNVKLIHRTKELEEEQAKRLAYLLFVYLFCLKKL